MAYDMRSYFERRNERRMERLNEEAWQRNLARAASGEMAAAHQQGLEAIGHYDQKQNLAGLRQPQQPKIVQGDEGAWYSPGGSKFVGEPTLSQTSNSMASLGGALFQGEPTLQQKLAAPAPSPAAPAPTPAPAPVSGIFHPDDDSLTPRAGGGPANLAHAYLVGEKGPEIFVPKQDGHIIPNHKIKLEPRAEGGLVEGGNPLRYVLPRRNNLINGLMPRRQRTQYINGPLPPTAAEAMIQGHNLTYKTQQEQMKAKQEEAEKDRQNAIKVEEIKSKSHEPQMIVANLQKEAADRAYLKEYNTKRQLAYNEVMGEMKAKWPTILQAIQEDWKRKHGELMPAKELAILQNPSDAAMALMNKSFETPEFQKLRSMGMPSEGESSEREGLLVAHGFNFNKADGSWVKEDTNPQTGEKYVASKITSTPNGIHVENMPGQKFQGPGIYRENNRWVGVNGPMQVPPKILTMDQALNKEFINRYNQKADSYNLPKIGNDLIQQNPTAAAWQVLNGINKMNQSIQGDRARTYIMNDQDTLKAMKGHEDYLNPNTAPPTANPGTPVANNMEPIQITPIGKAENPILNSITPTGEIGPSLTQNQSPASTPTYQEAKQVEEKRQPLTNMLARSLIKAWPTAPPEASTEVPWHEDKEAIMGTGPPLAEKMISLANNPRLQEIVAKSGVLARPEENSSGRSLAKTLIGQSPTTEQLPQPDKELLPFVP